MRPGFSAFFFWSETEGGFGVNIIAIHLEPEKAVRGLDTILDDFEVLEGGGKPERGDSPATWEDSIGAHWDGDKDFSHKKERSH